MGAPSGTVWGSIVEGSSEGRQGRLGLHVSLSSTATATTATVQVWFWTIYSCSDYANRLFLDIGANITSATTNRGSWSVNHQVDEGVGWDTANQTKLFEKTETISRSASAQSIKVYASFHDIEILNRAVYVNTSFTVPATYYYTISYNANGGTGAPSSQTKSHNVSLKLSTTKPTRTNYTFLGWATSDADADAGTWKYSPGDYISENKNLTLYAAWKANTYTVKYNANGGTGAPSSQTKTHNVALTLSSTKPTRANYNFLGWGTSASATTVSYTAGGKYTTNANVTLYAIWSQSYTKPRITNYTVSRCDANGNESDLGTYARVTFGWACDKTLSSIVIECISSANETSSVTVSASGTSGSVDKIIGGSLSTGSTYTVRAVVTDAGGYNRVSRTLPGTKFVIDFLAGGNGVSFGKPAEMSGYVDFGWNAHFTNNLKICGRDLDGNIKEAFQPVNSYGNTIVGWSNYDMKAGNTNVYGHDVHIGVSNIANPDYYRPYCRQGDTLTFNITTAGYLSSGGTKLYFIIPLSMPIIGSPTVTAASVKGFVLRQNNAYTHGSNYTNDAYVYTVPSSYSASITMRGGIAVTATFSNSTNAVNNSPIGIQWNGTITFT